MLLSCSILQVLAKHHFHCSHGFFVLCVVEIVSFFFASQILLQVLNTWSLKPEVNFLRAETTFALAITKSLVATTPEALKNYGMKHVKEKERVQNKNEKEHQTKFHSVTMDHFPSTVL